MIAPAVALSHIAPEILEPFSDLERLVLPHMHDLWLRPEQRIPRSRWRYYGLIAGRGFGKTHAITVEINRRVEAGEARHILLMAPNDDRTELAQVAPLIDASPPWFKAERYKGGVIWPNGVRAYPFTAEAPDAPRGENADLSWLTEIVAWPRNTRMAAFHNITTATRIGMHGGQVLWDTTSKGQNDVILHLLDLHDEDPKRYPIQRGTMLDNYMLGPDYLRAEVRKYPPGRRRDEEVYGKVFRESGGALWTQAWIDDHRRAVAPSPRVQRILSADPALTVTLESDETGLMVGELDAAGDVYITKDLSGKHAPEKWADMVIDECTGGASGLIYERNRGGDFVIALIRARAERRGLEVREANDLSKPFPLYTPGVIYVRQYWSRDSKESRAAAPAAHYEAGRVHHVGTFDELESELTTYEPGSSRSPNRYDAAVYLVLELAGLDRETAPNAKAAVNASADMHARMRAALGGLVSRRRVGL
jgi:phage terminase large subunit-like protein